VPLTLPGLNEIIAASGSHYTRGKKRYSKYAALKKQYENLIISAIQLAKIKPVKRAYFIYNWIEENRKRDPSNISAGGRKLIEDALVSCNILHNDGWACVAGWHDNFSVKRGRQKAGVRVQIFPDGG